MNKLIDRFCWAVGTLLLVGLIWACFRISL